MPSDTRNDHRVDQAVADTFPASDPATQGTSSGARAVAPDEVMRSAGPPPRPHPDGVTLHHRFRDAAAAKLALEALVREGPIDRRLAELRPDGDGADLRVQVPRAEAGRLGDMLRRQGGEES